MTLKINDLCYCKSDLYIGRFVLIKYEYYRVELLHHNKIVINSEHNDLIFSDSTYCSYLYFYDYFYTKKEERTIKLKKLSNGIKNQ